MSRVNAATSSQEHFSIEEQNPTDTKVQAVAQQNIEPPPEKERPLYKRAWRFVFKPVENGIRYVKHHPKECLIAVGTAVVVVGGLILASQSGDYPDNRPPGIIDEDLDPFAPYDNLPPPINPQPRPNYPPQQTAVDTPPPLPERSPDRSDQLMEKMERMKQENEEKKAQNDQLVSNNQNSENTPDSRQTFLETPLTEVKSSTTESAIYPATSLPKATTAFDRSFSQGSPLDSDEFVSQLVEQSGAFLNSSFDVVTFKPSGNATDQVSKASINPVDLDQLMSAIDHIPSPKIGSPQLTPVALDENFKQTLPNPGEKFAENPVVSNPLNVEIPETPSQRISVRLIPTIEELNSKTLTIDDLGTPTSIKSEKFDKNEINQNAETFFCTLDTSEIPDDPLPKAEVIFVNGIGNTREDAESSRDWSQNVAGVNSIELIYNRRRFPNIMDEATCAQGAKVKQAFQHGTFGLTNTSKKIILKALEFNQRLPSKEARLISKVHSRGALDTKIALKFLNEYYPEVAQKIIVVAVAPLDFIPKKMCARVYHLVSVGDPVPKLASETYASCKKEGTVIELPKKGSCINTHTLQGGPYEEKLREIFLDFHEEYEIQ